MARTLIRGTLQIQAESLTNALWSSAGGSDRLVEAKVLFDTGSGHDHDGVNSKSIAASGRTYSEAPAGAINGTNTNYTLAATPVAGSVRLFYNGQRLNAGAGNDYTISGTDIIILFTPETLDLFLADYNT